MPTERSELRKQTVLAAVHAQPGICFRALGRATGLPAGVLSHYARQLKKKGEIQDAKLRHRRTFYPGECKLPSEAEATMVREPALGTLRDWLEARGSTTQRAALDAMAALGWPRSTSQHRISRLVAMGVVQERRSGRYVLYIAATSESPGPSTLTSPHHVADGVLA